MGQKGRCSYRTSGSFFSMAEAQCGNFASPSPQQQQLQQMCLPGEVAGSLGPGLAPRGLPGCPGPGIPMQRDWSQGASCPGRTMAPLGDSWGTKALLSGIFYMHTCDLCLKWLHGKVSLSWTSAFKCSSLRHLLHLPFFFPPFLFFLIFVPQMPQERSCADNKVMLSSFWPFNRANL